MRIMSTPGIIILNDGQYRIHLNRHFNPATAPGFLEVHCPLPRIPAGYEHIGSYEQLADGRWKAVIDIPHSIETGENWRMIYRGRNRLDAIAALWMARHDAYYRH